MSAERLHACDVNYWHSNAAFLATSERGEVLESRDLFISNCGFPSTEFNRAFLKEPAGDVAAALSRAQAYFDAVELPFAFTVRADREAECSAALRAAGFERSGETPGMVLAPIPQPPAPPAKLEIRAVTDLAELAQFRETAFEGFGFPKQLGRVFISEQFFEMPGVVLLLGLENGVPVCTSSLVRTADVAGIYWVATLASARGRGYGEAVTWAAVEAGRDAGCRFASLQASEAGRPVYERMGFTTPLVYAKYERL